MKETLPGLLFPHADPGKFVQRISHPAMATIFEIWIHDPGTDYARQAAREAFEELDRLESELSRYIETSDISRVNQAFPGQAVRIGLEAFECLKECARLYADTNQLFDITLGNRIDPWKHPRRSVAPFSAPAQPVPIPHRPFPLALNEAGHTVCWNEEGHILDLGGIGKGYAIGRMAEKLREWEIDSALIHGGFSTVQALNPPPGLAGWPVALRDPRTGSVLRMIQLNNQSISGSGLRQGPHIIDPRTGNPVTGNRAAWAMAPRAAVADALSTTFMIMTKDEIRRFCQSHPGTEAWIMEEENIWCAEDESGNAIYGRSQ